MITISNETLSVSIATMGAELQNIYNKQTGIEYLWDANPSFWPKRSPVLFPVIGGLKDGSYTHNGGTYHFNRHGFARESEFTIEQQSDTSVTLVLETSTETLQVYPFQFKFSITYSLQGAELKNTYLIENKGTETLLFSVGAHPAFRVPLVEKEVFADYYLAFNEVEDAGIYPILEDGLISNTAVPFFNSQKELPLKKELFYKDALIFKELKSTSISILSKKSKHGLTYSYENFPYMGIWNAKDADFVCIEPWCGLGDVETTTGILAEKEGINKLEIGGSFTRSWTVATF